MNGIRTSSLLKKNRREAPLLNDYLADRRSGTKVMSEILTIDTEPPEDDGPLVFLEADESPLHTSGKTWKVLVADDDNEVHVITQMVLRDYVFDGRQLELLGARSGAETLKMLADHPDTAVILLDVVMETEHAGLDVARKIRESLGNRFVRIILRTGQPGQAPERSVIIDYDINDYKEKTELTAQKLLTAVITALRSYRDIITIERSRQGLTRIIEASRDMFGPQSLERLSSGVLQQISALLHLGTDGVLVQSSGISATHDVVDRPGDYLVLAGTGRFSDAVGQALGEVLSDNEVALLKDTPCDQAVIRGGEFVGHFCASGGAESFVLVQTESAKEVMEVDLMRLFAANIGVAFDNVHLHQELEATQSELVHTLSEVVEARSNETGRHVFRVGELSRLLAQLTGHNERDCTLLRQTAPMHDLGKIGIPDLILHKSGPLSADEWTIMQSHAGIGEQLLQKSRRPALQMAALIAGQHHEWWNGEGYPKRLQGEGIHPFGRIVALIDVFDALSHTRSYKQAWSMDRIIDHIRSRSAIQFEPALVDIFYANADKFIELWSRYPDPD